jgi:hypothetical protein
MLERLEDLQARVEELDLDLHEDAFDYWRKQEPASKPKR